MTRLFKFTLSLLPWIPAFFCWVTTVDEVRVLEGGSITVPCRYDPQYANHVKYWCWGSMREFCSSLARTDETHPTNPTEDKVSIFDDPAQAVFTVTMNNLKEGESGWYMCGVELGNGWKPDDVAFTKVKVIHGMSVMNSVVSGEEGGTVAVECLYSERYRGSEKKWCRSGGWSSCLSTGSEGSYEDASVAISDDRTRAFTVTLKKLQMRDAGWYLCSAGQQQVPVQVQVTPRSSTTESVTSPPTPGHSAVYVPPPKPITKESWNSHRQMLESVAVCSALMFLVGLAILARKLWILHKEYSVLRQVKEIEVRFPDNPGNVSDLQNAPIVFHNKETKNTHLY
ncbi:polymeric immunoglobulin receptor isoform X2 [Archocentrus centrarchus]|uniref:polymeric immunoglobulin receptor isoform X2 n=1 Tax=Archocentrus centrarchus TaxID=63155 RepID=UPI0011EA1E76|nr:polymeric immunoglobulin receptor-like isoform X2 [Archocentrus centrarchus]